MKRRPLVWNRVNSFITVREGRGVGGVQEGREESARGGRSKGMGNGRKGGIIQQHFYL